MKLWQNMLTRSISFDDVFYTLERLSGHHASVSQASRLHHEVRTVQSRISGITEEGTYLSMYAQAAMLLRHLTKRCLADGGDTRVAWMLTAIFLEVNGYSVTHATSDEVSEIMASVIEKDAGVSTISRALQAIAEHPRNEPLFP